MIKRIVLTLLQFVAFLGLLFLGGNWDSVNLSLQMRQMQQGIMPHVYMETVKVPMGSHILIANGLIFATVLLILIVLVQAVRRRLHPWALLSGLAYVLAVTLSLAMKLGLPPAN